MDLDRKQGVRGFELRESQRMMGGKAERWRGTDIGSCEHTEVKMSGEVVRRRRKKGGKRRREEEEREEKDEQREEEEEEPILVTDAAAKDDLVGGTHSTLAKSLFLAGILGRHQIYLNTQVVIF